MLERALAETGRYWRELTLLAVVVVSALAMMLVPPIAQSLAYHKFADSRTLWQIPNFLNVATNVPFLLVGIMGLAYCLRHVQSRALWSWYVVFLGIAAVCFGSAYYHWQPDSATLVWDRLPMTLAFMGLFVALLREHVAMNREGMWLAIALVMGVASVIYWHYTDDLRPYIWVQAVPFMVVAAALTLFRGQYSHRYYLVYGLVFYALAKVAELFDRQIYSFTQELLSGHSLKHLLAAAGAFFLYLMLRRRRGYEMGAAS